MKKIKAEPQGLLRKFPWLPKLSGPMVLVLILAVTCGIRIYWLSQKSAFHNDEVLSIIVSEGGQLGVSYNYAYGIAYPGKAIKEASFMTDTTFKDMWADIYELWRNYGDANHTNFYLSLFRLALGRLKSGEIMDAKVRGGILNLILYCISFFAFFFLMKLLFKNNKVIPYLAVFCAFVSTGPISNTLYFRLYQLQESLMMVFSYFFIKYRDVEKLIKTEDKKIYLDLAFAVFVTLSTALFFWSGYFSLIFIASVGIYAVCYSIFKKKPIEIGVYFAVLFCAVLLCQVLYQLFITDIVYTVQRGFSKIKTYFQPAVASVAQAAGGGGGGVLAAASKTQLEREMEMINTMPPIKTMLSFLYTYFWNLQVIIVTAVTAFFVIAFYLIDTKNKPRLQEILSKKNIAAFCFSPRFIMTVAALIFITLSITSAEFKELRYGVPAYPLMIIIPMVILEKIKDKRLFYALCAAFVVCFSINMFNVNKVWGVWRDVPARYKFTKEPQIPVFIICNSNHYPLLIPYLADEQTYIFDDNIQSALNKFQFDEFFIVINDPLIPTNPIRTQEMGLEVLDTYRTGVNIGLWTVGKFRHVQK